MIGRKEAEVVKAALALLDEQEKADLHIAERVESRLTRKELKALLAPFKDSGASATQETFDEIKSYLGDRAKKRLIGTSALYCYQRSIPANKACIALATDLKTVFPQYRIIKLLLPNVKMLPEKFESKHFNDFVVTEDGYFLGVSEGLEAARADKRHQYFHPAKRELKNGELEQYDPDLLTDHSTEAWRYAMLIGGLIGKVTEDELSKCDTARDDLVAFISGGKSQRREPAHNEAGRKRLMLSLTSNIHSLNELAEFMDDCVQQHEWEEFLQYAGIEELSRIVIPVRERNMQKAGVTDDVHKKDQANKARTALDELLTAKTQWPESDNAKRALCYVLAYLKHDLRDSAYDYNSYTAATFGRLGSSLFGQKTKDQAKSYTEAYKKFLSTTTVDMQQVPIFIKSQGLADAASSTLDLQNKIVDGGRHYSNEVGAKLTA